MSKPRVSMDSFGSGDPARMPRHLFRDAVSVIFESAERADITRQNYTVCPRHWYVDAIFRCADCGTEFHFPASEQQFWYEELKFYVDSLPRRCPGCRKKERARKLEAKRPKAQ